jgi:HK97 family phage portal protein
MLDRAFSSLVKRSDTTSGGVTFADNLSDLFSFSTTGGVGPVNHKSALKISAVYNAVEQISNDIAKIPFGIYSTENGQRQRLRNHPADILISQEPNPIMTPFVFKKLIGVSLMLRGNALFYLQPVTNSRQIAKYIDWSDVYDVREKDFEIYYYVKGYDKPLLSSEVLHFKQFSLDGICGISTIKYAALQLGLSLKTQELSITNYDNKGVRQGVIETDKVMAKGKDAVIAGWRKGMAEKSADRVVVLDEGMKFKPITITPQELQLIEQARFNVEDIARWFNIAPHKIKSLQQSTNNNIEQQSLDHVSDTIQPYVTNIEQEFAKKLLTSKQKATHYCKANLNVLLRADIKSRGEYYSKMLTAGAYSREEVRALEDMDKGPEFLGEFLTPVNTFTESQLKKNLMTNE